MLYNIKLQCKTIGIVNYIILHYITQYSRKIQEIYREVLRNKS